MKLIKLDHIWLKDYPDLDERWVQTQIALDPSILGLGDLELRDRERLQPRAGRLDLLLQDPESLRRYEVELQLGAADESHIIRTLEYWDIERKRYPQYDHCAVIVAEEVTGRFLNVISLFNGFIPLVAVQMSAHKVSDGVALLFTRVVDELRLGLMEEDQNIESTDRNYWVTKATPETVILADRLLALIQSFAPGLELKYNKYYIGLATNGHPSNFVIFIARKKVLRLVVNLTKSDEIDRVLEESELNVVSYNSRSSRYELDLRDKDAEDNHATLLKILKMAYDEFGK